MTKTLKFDVFIIGSGSAGKTVAEQCAKKGLKTAIADNRAYGGTCANRGCDPKKVLLTVAETLELSQNLKSKGVKQLPTLDWPTIQQFKRSFTEDIPQATEENLIDQGITLFHESPRFIDHTTLSVENQTIQAKNIVIATGLIPAELPFDKDGKLPTSDDFLNMEQLPETAAFIGAGYIAMEFAHLLAVLGCQVTVFDTNDRILSDFDATITSALQEKSEHMGIDFKLGAEIKSAEINSQKTTLQFELKDEKYTQAYDVVFNTAGRVPAVQTLDMESAGVKFDDKGIAVNEYLQSVTNANVYACGDVSNHGLPLTPLSGAQGAIVAKNIINKNTKKVNHSVVATAVYTFPNVAAVGHSEEEARKVCQNIDIKQGDASDWYNAKRQNEMAYTYKIIVNVNTNQILGAHLIGPHAAETINIFAMAIQHEITIDKIKSMMFAYPTMAYDIKSMLS